MIILYSLHLHIYHCFNPLYLVLYNMILWLSLQLLYYTNTTPQLISSDSLKTRTRSGISLMSVSIAAALSALFIWLKLPSHSPFQWAGGPQQTHALLLKYSGTCMPNDPKHSYDLQWGPLSVQNRKVSTFLNQNPFYIQISLQTFKRQIRFCKHTTYKLSKLKLHV